jgi:uncharacterized protein YbaA (DUF1428 family)
MAYVDGFVFTVPKKNLAAYRKMARQGRDIWMKLGALDYKECMGDDLTPKSMGGPKPRSFKEMAKAGSGDTVWFSFIVYKSRKHRDQVNKKMMAEMEKVMEKYKDFKMPFDMAKMAYGGFTVEVDK